MTYNLSYDTPYIRGIQQWYRDRPGFHSSDRVGEYSVHKGDRRLTGGATYNSTGVYLNSQGSRYLNFDPSMTNQYYRVGYSPSYPLFNRNDLENVNRLNRPTALQGGGEVSDNPGYDKVSNRLINLFELELNKKQGKGIMTGGKFDIEKIKKKVTPVAKFAAKTGLDLGVPIVSTTLGTTIGTALGNPALGAVVGKVLGKFGRKGIKKLTGLGMIGGQCGVGVYTGGRTLKPSTNMQKRNMAIKRLMATKGMTLPEASAYLKRNNM